MTTVEDITTAEQTEYATRDAFTVRKNILDAEMQDLLAKYQARQISGPEFASEHKIRKDELKEMRKNVFLIWQKTIDTKHAYAKGIDQAPIDRIASLELIVKEAEKILSKAKADLAIEKLKISGDL